jgi:thiamine-phosphate pyrophosphorylase
MSDEPDEPHRTRLYLVSPPAFDPEEFAPRLESAFAGGDIAVFQLRLKGVADDAVLRAAEALMPICHDYDAAFIVNDSPELARDAGADGVHIGQDDMPYRKARAIVGEGAIVGVTCHNSRHLAMEAADADADYVAFGAFFPSTTKDPKATADIDILDWWVRMMVVPAVAIGGITPANCRPLVEVGVDFIAVGGGVWNHPEGPAAAVAAFNEVFDEEEVDAR